MGKKPDLIEYREFLIEVIPDVQNIEQRDGDIRVSKAYEVGSKYVISSEVHQFPGLSFPKKSLAKAFIDTFLERKEKMISARKKLLKEASRLKEEIAESEEHTKKLQGKLEKIRDEISDS